MLLGRALEQERIDALLEGCREGEGGCLLLRGEPGVGKSTLLGYAREQATDMRVLSVRGLAAESELPFAGLTSLLDPVLDRLGELPENRGEALRGALARGPPGAGDRFAVYVAVLDLLATVAEDTPFLLLVDDAHWLDTPSVEALAFVGRRLTADSIALLLAAREDGAVDPSLADLPALYVTGLSREAATALLQEAASVTVDPEVADRLWTETTGNPLAISELSRLLSGDQLTGRAPLDDPLPISGGIERAFRERIEGLPADVQTELLVAAASDSGDMGEISRALERLGVGSQALESAEEAGLISLDYEGLAFNHPLLRSTAYHSAAPRRRRAAHQALAAVSGNPARRAWHLASAAMAPDEAVAAELESAAVEARARSAPATAGATFEVAARLSPQEDLAVKRLLESGRAFTSAGREERALSIFEEARARSSEEFHAPIQLARAEAIRFRRPVPEVRHFLLSEAEGIERTDPGAASQLFASLAGHCSCAGDVPASVEAARRAYDLARSVGGPPELLAAFVYGGALITGGEGEAGYPLVLKSEPLLELPEIVTETWIGAAFALPCLWVEDFGRANRAIHKTVEELRRVGAVGGLPYALGVQSAVEYRLGRWESAYAVAAESVELGGQLGQTVELAWSLCRLVDVEAGQGRADEARKHLTRALELADELGAGSARVDGEAALGRLELGMGQTEQAIDRLGRVARLADEAGLLEPAVVLWAGDLIEACVRGARLAEAEKAIDRLESEAERTGRAWAHAVAARGRGLTAADQDVDDRFERAFEYHGRAEQPFERARTELCLGERLRRGRRAVEARVHLSNALRTFERLGARPWAGRARRELTATGDRSTPQREHERRADLTPQELRVALQVAEGKTNNEVASALFVTPKTIEAHLGRIYRKLGVRSRSELTRRLISEGLALQTGPAGDEERGSA